MAQAGMIHIHTTGQPNIRTGLRPENLVTDRAAKQADQTTGNTDAWSTGNTGDVADRGGRAIGRGERPDNLATGYTGNSATGNTGNFGDRKYGQFGDRKYG